MGIPLNLFGFGNKCWDLLGSNQVVRTSLGMVKKVLGARIRKIYFVLIKCGVFWALRNLEQVTSLMSSG